MPPGATSVISSARATGETHNTARTAVDDNRSLMDGHSRSDARPERHRLFIAIALPDPIRQAIEKAQDDLRAALPTKSIRWTRSDQFHLTMRFLGGVETQRVDRLDEAVRSACAGAGVLRLRAAGIGVFPGPRRPRVVWTGVGDRDQRLAKLQRSIEAATSAFTDEPPQDKFTGHITLARCRDINRAEASTLAALVEAMEHRSFGEWNADGVDIIRSQPTPQGSRYTTLATIGLG
jgi:2'-5' RNA ligase